MLFVGIRFVKLVRLFRSCFHLRHLIYVVRLLVVDVWYVCILRMFSCFRLISKGFGF